MGLNSSRFRFFVAQKAYLFRSPYYGFFTSPDEKVDVAGPGSSNEMEFRIAQDSKRLMCRYRLWTSETSV